MAEADPQVRALGRSAAGDQGGGRQRALHPDRVGAPGRRGQPAAGRRHRVYEDRQAEPRGLGEERQEALVADRGVQDVRGDLDPAQPLVADRGQLGGGGFRVLQRHNAEPDQPGRVEGAQLRGELVDVARQGQAVGGRQVVAQQRRHRREHLGVDPGGRHRLHPPLRLEEHVTGLVPHGAEDQRPGGAPVDRLHPGEALGSVGRVVTGQQVSVGIDQHGSPPGWYELGRAGLGIRVDRDVDRGLAGNLAAEGLDGQRGVGQSAAPQCSCQCSWMITPRMFLPSSMS
jgi:hypothetical protein